MRVPTGAKRMPAQLPVVTNVAGAERAAALVEVVGEPHERAERVVEAVAAARIVRHLAVDAQPQRQARDLECAPGGLRRADHQALAEQSVGQAMERRLAEGLEAAHAQFDDRMGGVDGFDHGGPPVRGAVGARWQAGAQPEGDLGLDADRACTPRVGSCAARSRAGESYSAVSSSGAEWPAVRVCSEAFQPPMRAPSPRTTASWIA